MNDYKNSGYWDLPLEILIFMCSRAVTWLQCFCSNVQVILVLRLRATIFVEQRGLENGENTRGQSDNQRSCTKLHYYLHVHIVTGLLYPPDVKGKGEINKRRRQEKSKRPF